MARRNFQLLVSYWKLFLSMQGVSFTIHVIWLVHIFLLGHHSQSGLPNRDSGGKKQKSAFLPTCMVLGAGPHSRLLPGPREEFGKFLPESIKSFRGPKILLGRIWRPREEFGKESNFSGSANQLGVNPSHEGRSPLTCRQAWKWT